MVDFYNELFHGEPYNGVDSLSKNNDGLDYNVLSAIEDLAGEENKLDFLLATETAKSEAIVAYNKISINEKLSGEGLSYYTKVLSVLGAAYGIGVCEGEGIKESIANAYRRISVYAKKLLAHVSKWLSKVSVSFWGLNDERLRIAHNFKAYVNSNSKFCFDESYVTKLKNWATNSNDNTISGIGYLLSFWGARKDKLDISKITERNIDTYSELYEGIDDIKRYISNLQDYDHLEIRGAKLARGKAIVNVTVYDKEGLYTDAKTFMLKIKLDSLSIKGNEVNAKDLHIDYDMLASLVKADPKDIKKQIDQLFKDLKKILDTKNLEKKVEPGIAYKAIVADSKFQVELMKATAELYRDSIFLGYLLYFADKKCNK